MSDSIHVLSDAVANQIAAGEVIQRPASVVKELMENAVDAGATSITVMVKDAGKSMIQVLDNGTGMSRNDAQLCFQRHATSKISRAEDLFAVRTTGFRGEALASVAAVGEVELKTRRAEDELGTRVRVSGSVVKPPEPVQVPVGTNLIVKNLFFNIPARRKFLKSDHTELRHIINEFNHVALTNQDIECSLMHNHTEILHLPPSNIKQRITGIFGKSLNSYLIPVENKTSIIKISGFIGKPEHARRKYGEQFFFVNNRYIKHPYFHKAVMSAYENILAPDHVPSYFIYFETDPSRIDVNIHPSKTEVKFEEERSIWQILHATSREAIGRHNLSPSLDFSKEGVIDIPVLKKDTEVQIPDIEIDPTYNPFKSEQGGNLKEYPHNKSLDGWEKLFEPHSDTAVFFNNYLQIKNKYILTPVKSGIMVIDQRRAHERILYEKLLDEHKNPQLMAQHTLFPETIRLNPADYQVCLGMLEILEQVGFDIRDLGNHTLVVHGIPSFMSPARTKEKLEMMIEQYISEQGNPDSAITDQMIRAAARAAAIDYGRKLSGVEIRDLVDQLFACSNPNYAPSGKPVVKIIDLEELDGHFKT